MSTSASLVIPNPLSIFKCVLWQLGIAVPVRCFLILQREDSNAINRAAWRSGIHHRQAPAAKYSSIPTTREPGKVSIADAAIGQMTGWRHSHRIAAQQAAKIIIAISESRPERREVAEIFCNRLVG